MKKLPILNCFCMLLLFITCKQDLSPINYIENNEEKEGFAITCDDLRIGEILAIIEEGEFKKDITNDPFMKVIATNIHSYITSTLRNWEKLKKGKKPSRSAFRDMVESDNYTYSNWTLLNGNLNNILKTKWNQMKPYNRVINELIGGNFPSGCVTTAIAQVMAFHEYPPSYVGYAHKDFRYFKNEIKDKIPAIENWYGKYDWKEIKTNEKVRLTLDYVHCNPGWGGTSNGYYISDIFSFNLGANANDYEIKSDKEGYYKYEIKIFSELIPETRLNFDLFFDWYPL